MKYVLKIVSLASLALLTVPSFMFLAGRMSLPTVKLFMLIATVMWFACLLPEVIGGRETQ